jgi:hypothetical protein
MKVIQLWRNDTYPKELLRCVESVLRFVDKSDYTLICNNSEIAQRLDVGSKNFDEEFHRILGAIGDHDWWDKYCTMNMYRADMMRLYYATQIPDLLYFDIDTVLLRMPEFKSVGKPYFYNGDIRIFYVNGQIGWFSNLLKTITSQLTPQPFVIYNYVRSLHLDRNNMFNMDNRDFFVTDFGQTYKV